MLQRPKRTETKDLAAGALGGARARTLSRLRGMGELAYGIAHGVSRLAGWRRALVAMGAGALGVLGQAPFFFLPALCLSLVVLLWLMDGCAEGSRARAMWRGAMTGWFYSFGYLFPGLLWVGNAFLVDADVFAWVMPFAVTLLPAGLSLFAAVALGIAGRFWTLSPSRVFLLGAAWMLGEWVRGHAFTGFPWGLLGYAWAGHENVAQAAAVIGTYGLSFLTVVAFSSAALLAVPAEGERPRSWGVTAAMAVLLVLVWGAGAVRIATATDGPVEGVRLRIVQPGTRQTDRRDPEKRGEIWLNLLNLSRDARARGITHIIWPEAAPPFAVTRDMPYGAEIAGLLDPGMALLTGAVRVEQRADGDYDYYNGFVVFDHQGTQQSIYDKHHLVPFGEYMPFKKVFEAIGLEKVANGVGTLTPGPGPATLPLEHGPAFSPVICYEIIFPGEVTQPGARPGWIVNVTDDDWFGDSIGPRQHLAIARMRAIEENMPVVRSANSGISALIDRFGRVRRRIPLHKTAVIDTDLPQAGARTLYGLVGDWPVLLAAVLGLGFAARRRF